MESDVYTLPKPDKNNYLLDDETDDSPVRLRFSYRHLPKADASSGIVRFRSVTPKQQFTRSADQPESDVLLEAHNAAVRHRELAADHMAAALWLSVCVPIVKAPKPRKQVSTSKNVTIPTDNRYVEASDFNTARSAAGVFMGNYATDVHYLEYAGTTGDGRPQHKFEVTYYWSEVEK